MRVWTRETWRRRHEDKMRANVPRGWGCLELQHPLWHAMMGSDLGAPVFSIHSFPWEKGSFHQRQLRKKKSFLSRTLGFPTLFGSPAVGTKGLWNARRQWFLKIWVFWWSLELTLVHSAEFLWLCCSFSEVWAVSFSNLLAISWSTVYFPYYFILVKHISLLHLSVATLQPLRMFLSLGF